MVFSLYIYRQNSYYESLRRPSYVQVQEIAHDIGQVVQDVAKVQIDIPALNALALSQGLTESSFIIKGQSGKMELTDYGVFAVERFKKKEANQ